MIANISSWLGPLVDRWYEGLQWSAFISVLVAAAATGLTTYAGIRSNREGSRQIAELTKQNIESQRALEAERIKRLEMAASLAPRNLHSFRFPNGTTSTDALKTFAGIKAFLKFASDVEPRNAADSIRVHLEAAGCIVEKEPVVDMGYSDVVIEAMLPAEGGTPEEQEVLERTQAAADTLADILEGNGWSARVQPVANSELPPNTIRVNVGVKRLRYFEPEPLKAASAETDVVARRLRKERLQAWRDEQQKRDNHNP